MLVGELVTIADKVGAIEAVKGKLLSKPDPAAEKLIIALEEIYKIYLTLEEALTSYLSVWLDPENPELAKAKAVLIALEGGEIQARMEKSRGSCRKITNIYDRYLRGWFSEVLNRNEADQLRALFREMADFDSYMVDAIVAVSKWLTVQASETLELLSAGDMSGAQRQVDAARRAILPDRRQISRVIGDLLTLQAEFTEVSGAL